MQKNQNKIKITSSELVIDIKLLDRLFLIILIFQLGNAY